MTVPTSGFKRFEGLRELGGSEIWGAQGLMALSLWPVYWIKNSVSTVFNPEMRI